MSSTRLMGIGAVCISAAALLLGGCITDGEKEETLQVRPSQALIDARTVLLRSVDDQDPVVRAYALESTADLLGKEAGGALMQALNDRAYNVRFVAAMSIGNIRYAPAREKLVEMAKPVKGVGEPDYRVLCAVVYALTQLGEDEYTRQLASGLASLLRHREPEIRAAAAWAMGAIGHPSAVVPLKGMVKDEQSDKARQTMIEALAVLGEERYQRFLEASKYSDMENRVSAVRTMGRVGTRDMQAVLSDMAWSTQPPQVRVVAMGELARLNAGSEQGLRYVRQCVRGPRKMLEDAMENRREVEAPEVYDLQQMAAEALGKTVTEVAVNDLHPLLNSPDAAVRVASATAVMKLLASYRPEQAAALGQQMQRRGEETEAAHEGRIESVPARPLETSGAKD